VRVLVPALILYALFGTAGAFMDSLVPLLVVRGLLGAASGGIAAASLGLLGGMYEGEARSQALGYATSALTIAGIAFPLLGGAVGTIHWQFAFYLYGLGLPLALLVALVFDQKPSSPTAQSGEKGDSLKFRTVLQDRRIWRVLLTLGLASIAMYAVVIYAPLYLRQTIGASTVVNGIVLATRAVGAALISAFGAKRLVQTLGAARTGALGFGLMALTLTTLPLLHQLGGILVAAVFFGAGFGLVLPTLYGTLANLAPPSLRSSVLAAGTGAGFLGQFLSPVLLGPILGYGGLESIFYGAAIVALGAGVLLFAPSQS
jgi:predicted MFS family arabinose efflux permease